LTVYYQGLICPREWHVTCPLTLSVARDSAGFGRSGVAITDARPPLDAGFLSRCFLRRVSALGRKSGTEGTLYAAVPYIVLNAGPRGTCEGAHMKLGLHTRRPGAANQAGSKASNAGSTDPLDKVIKIRTDANHHRSWASNRGKISKGVGREIC